MALKKHVRRFDECAVYTHIDEFTNQCVNRQYYVYTHADFFSVKEKVKKMCEKYDLEFIEQKYRILSVKLREFKYYYEINSHVSEKFKDEYKSLSFKIQGEYVFAKIELKNGKTQYLAYILKYC